MTPNAKFLAQFTAALRVSVPLIAVRTFDPAATIQLIDKEARKKEARPMVAWDIIRGVYALNEEGKPALQVLEDLNIDPKALSNPSEALAQAANFPKRTLFCFLNAHLFIKNESVMQGVWNLRDVFKTDFRALVMLCPEITLPSAVTSDVLVLDEPLPTTDELEAIASSLFEDANLPKPKAADLVKATDATVGLAAYPAEQALAMSLTKTGLDIDSLWERKRQTIEQVKGLSVYRGKERFDDIGGVKNAKTFFSRVLEGEMPPRAIVFIDEIEKSMSGSNSDTSGTSQEMLGTMLSWMQDKGATGVIAVGPPGCSKSMIAKAVGNTGNIPTIQFDLSGMKGSLVGESGENLRAALKIVDAVSQGRTLFIATCNAIANLPPELRRRFSFGTFFFDLPTKDEREAIWTLYISKFKLPKQERPQDEGWTGAEIRMCSDLAYRLKCSLKEAATYIVPVAKSAADSIEKLRTQASGRFIDASKPGPYRYEKQAAVGRAISTE